MRTLYRLFWLPLYRWWALRHIQQTRQYRLEGMDLLVPAGVFHPGVFFSTRIFIHFLKKEALTGKKVLDIGTGSGALAVYAARQGAVVTAIDIHPGAVAAASANLKSFPDARVLESDLFSALTPQTFDIVLLNPPYFAKKADNWSEHAFFAGEDLGYFRRLFEGLSDYIAPANEASAVWMILSEDCPLPAIFDIAARNGFRQYPVYTQKHWGERFTVYRFTRQPVPF